MGLIHEVLKVLESIEQKLPDGQWVTLELYSDGSGSFWYHEPPAMVKKRLRDTSHEIEFRNLEHLAEIVAIQLAEIGETNGATDY
jgi:hypothetical protein